MSPPRARHVKSTTAATAVAGVRVWPYLILLVCAGVLTYANALSGPFVLDDQDTIMANEQIRQLWPPSVVLFPAKELPVAGRPVVNVSFALNYARGGLDVWGYHAGNIAIHIVCALLLFGVIRRTLRLPSLRDRFADGAAASVAFACALLWLVHPLHTDAVDYVTQRTELMMGAFYLATLYASIRGVDRTEWLFLAVVTCLLGTGSKESMATMPVVVALYDRIFLFHSAKEAWRKRWLFYLSLAASWLLLAALSWSGPRSRSAGFGTSVTPWIYLLNQVELIVRYLRLSVWPRGLVILYGPPRDLSVVDLLPQFALLVVLALAVVWALMYRPKIGFLGAWFFITLAPASSIVPIATEVGAERRMYLPLAALVVLVVIGAVELWRWYGARVDRGLPAAAKARVEAQHPIRGAIVGFVLLAVVSVALAIGTIVRNREYASLVTLARLTMERWPTARAEHWLGIELIGAQQREEGIAALRHALPNEPNAHYSLGVTLFQDGKIDEAIEHLRAFLAREALRIEVPAAHETLGRALESQGKFADAEKEFREVLRMTPSSRDTYGLLGDALFNQEKYDEAEAMYRQFLRVHPDNLSAATNLGIALAATGHTDEAVAAFRRAVEIDPRDGAVRRNLARALLTKGSFDEAATHAREAVLLRPDDPVAHDELGLALAGQRKLDEALVEIRRALEIDPSDEEVRAHLAAVLQAKDGIMRVR